MNRLRPGAPPGYSLVELVVATFVGGILCAIALIIFAGSLRFTRLQGERMAISEARRVASTILGAELRYLAAGADLLGVDTDSVALRAFRGRAVVCAVAGTVATVRYRGLRAPDPEKDSVLSVGGAGPAGSLTSALLASGPIAGSTTPEGCARADGESLHRWNLATPVPTGSLLLLFETGSYHLTGRALRYRRGASGRQPLTAELFDDDDTALGFTASGTIELVLTSLPRRKSNDGAGSSGTAVRYLLGIMNGGEP